MVHAYAIDPAILPLWAERKNYRLIVSSFGLGTPRVHLIYPINEWSDLVDNARMKASLSPIEEKRLEELLALFTDAIVRRKGATYDPTKTWIENAAQEYQRREFTAIITHNNPNRIPYIITDDTIENTDPRWNKPIAKTPGKKSSDLVSAVCELLENSSEVHFVDPYFGLSESGYKDPFDLLLARCTRCDTITIHCNCDKDITHFEQSAKNFSSRIPSGLKVKFKRWRSKDTGQLFHNRYILTNIGGLVLGNGFRTYPGRDYTDDVNLMSEDQYNLRWRQYCGAKPAFDLVDVPAEVVGTRT